MNRPYQPPPAPEVPIPAMPPAPAPTGLAGRLASVRALAALGGLLWQVPPAALVLLGGQAPDPALLGLWELAGAGGLLLVGVVWLLLDLRRDLYHFAAERDRDAIERAALVAGYAQTRRSRRDWDAHHAQAAAQPRERVISIHSDRARVQPTAAETDAVEHPTRQLHSLPPAGPQYYGTPAEAICAALLAGREVSVRTRPAGLSRESFEAAVQTLTAAGILTRRRGRGPALAADFAHLGATPTYAHAVIARRLGVPSPTGAGVRED